MPAVVAGDSHRNEHVSQALKTYIMRERQRKKQEQEADEEEERQRKERETKQKQHVMTIGETREQIAQVERELEELRKEKHELFGQLKKVLHEDDNRKRQYKETIVSSEQMHQVGGYPEATVVHPHLYMPHPTRSPIYKVAAVTPSHTLLSGGPMKRSHSPSPPPSAPTVYHPGYGYKPPLSMPSYIPPPSKSEDARRSGDARVVLWNKSPSQFPGSSYYPPGSYDFGPPTSQTSRLPEPGKPVYLTATRTPLPTIQTSPYTEDKFYSRPGSHVAVHGGAIPIQQPPQGAKTGGITSGYPVRAPQPPPPQAPYPQHPPGTYVSVAGAPGAPGRLLYTQPGPRYIPRDV